LQATTGLLRGANNSLLVAGRDHLNGRDLTIKVSAGDAWEISDPVVVDPVTVASLPAAAAGNKGWQRTVSNSTTISAEGQTCVGGGTDTALAFSNGVVWKCF
jgi:hypothetical protein